MVEELPLLYHLHQPTPKTILKWGSLTDELCLEFPTPSVCGTQTESKK